MADTTAAEDNVAKLYEVYEELNDAPQSAEGKDDKYQVVLDAVKGSDREKNLAASFIPKFFHLFPALADPALNAQIDLCEDAEERIRMLAIPGLLEICRNSPTHVPHVATVLGQLLLTEESNAKLLSVVHRIFCDIFDQAPAEAFEALGAQATGEDEAARAVAREFMGKQAARLRARVKKEDEVQAALAAVLVRILTAPGVTREAFRANLRELQRLKVYRADESIPRSIVDALAEQGGVGADFKGDEAAATALAEAASLARAVAGRLDVTPWVDHLFGRVVPAWEAVPEASRVAVLKSVLPMVYKASDAAAAAAVPRVVELFASAVPAEDGAEANFAVAEMALLALHQLGPKAEDAIKNSVGLFTPTGQPSEFREEIVSRREAFVGRLDAVVAQAEAAAAKAAEALKELGDKAKEARKTKDEDEEKFKEAMAAINAERDAFRPAARVASNFKAMAAALKTKGGPRYLANGKDVTLSWQAAPKADKKGKGKAQADAPPAKRQKTADAKKGGQKQPQQQQQQQKKKKGKQQNQQQPQQQQKGKKGKQNQQQQNQQQKQNQPGKRKQGGKQQQQQQQPAAGEGGRRKRRRR